LTILLKSEENYAGILSKLPLITLWAKPDILCAVNGGERVIIS
jgi:hypothetical protein